MQLEIVNLVLKVVDMDEYLKNYYSVVRGRINSLRGHLDSRPSPSTETFLKDRVPLAAFGLVGFLFQDVIGGPHSPSRSLEEPQFLRRTISNQLGSSDNHDTNLQYVCETSFESGSAVEDCKFCLFGRSRW